MHGKLNGRTICRNGKNLATGNNWLVHLMFRNRASACNVPFSLAGFVFHRVVFFNEWKNYRIFEDTSANIYSDTETQRKTDTHAYAMVDKYTRIGNFLYSSENGFIACHFFSTIRSISLKFREKTETVTFWFDGNWSYDNNKLYIYFSKAY